MNVSRCLFWRSAITTQDILLSKPFRLSAIEQRKPERTFLSLEGQENANHIVHKSPPAQAKKKGRAGRNPHAPFGARWNGTSG